MERDYEKIIEVRAPATIANLVCGFDILGMALDNPCDTIRMRLLPYPEIVLHAVNDDSIPLVPEKNTAGRALMAFQSRIHDSPGFEVWLEKGIRPGSGLGSSAASAAGAVVAANLLLGEPLDQLELVLCAMEGESASSGAGHADNVAPCIYGGVTLVRSTSPLDIVKLDYPRLYVTVIHPHIEVRTSDARSILRRQIRLEDAVKQWGNIAGLIAGMQKGDFNLIGRSLQDHLIEPIRSMLIPGFNRMRDAAMNAGALGGGISGAGPSIFVLAASRDVAENSRMAMENIWTEMGIGFEGYVGEISVRGAGEVDRH
jgi:homoserine kinase